VHVAGLPSLVRAAKRLALTIRRVSAPGRGFGKPSFFRAAPDRRHWNADCYTDAQ